MAGKRMIDLILERFRASGLSIKQLAERADVPYGALHPIIAGKRDCRLATAEKLCRVLGLVLVPDKKQEARRK